MKIKVVFIINPISGGKNKSGFPALVTNTLDQQRFECSFILTGGTGDASVAASEALSAGADVVVAVGGDGTINETAMVLAGSGKPMGIVPFGSGNGLARSLGIPLRPALALQTISRMTTTQIDTGEMNSRLFVNMAGMGFDAHISSIFARNRKRGAVGYLLATIKEVLRFGAGNYQVKVDDRQISCHAYMISIANSPQYGNNAYISPGASLNDGMLDVCILHRFPLIRLPVLFFMMFNRSTDRFGPLEIVRGKAISIKRDSSAPVHLDGEPLQLNGEIQIKVSPSSLIVLT